MRKTGPLLLAALAIFLAGACIATQPTNAPTSAPQCGPTGDEDPADDSCPGEDQAVRHPPGGLPQLLPTPGPAGLAPGTPARVETVVDGVSMPLGLVWTPDGRKMFFSEVKQGTIRVVVDGALQTQPFATLPIAKGAETGMLGLAIDPDYARNRFLYAYHSDPETSRNRVLRFEDRDGQPGAPVEILRSVAVSTNGGAHNGGRLAFGADGMLYVTAGNGQNARIGQDPCRLGGKILRIQKEGAAPPDNPYQCAPTFAYGFRNPFGIAFHPLTGALYATDNGGRGRDELDLIQRGGNYGHSVVEGIANNPSFIDPLWESGPVSIGPTGLTFYTGDRLPEFKGDLFFCAVHTGQLSRVRLAAPGYDRVEAMNVEIMRDQVDCRLDVANGPDGALYFTNFSKIMRITR